MGYLKFISNDLGSISFFYNIKLPKKQLRDAINTEVNLSTKEQVKYISPLTSEISVIHKPHYKHECIKKINKLVWLF